MILHAWLKIIQVSVPQQELPLSGGNPVSFMADTFMAQAWLILMGKSSTDMVNFDGEKQHRLEAYDSNSSSAHTQKHI